MNEETTEKITDENAVLKAIAELSAKFDAAQKSSDIQFEPIRRGIVDNAIRFDRLEGEIYLLRSEVSHIKADLKELNRAKELV